MIHRFMQWSARFTDAMFIAIALGLLLISAGISLLLILLAAWVVS